MTNKISQSFTVLYHLACGCWQRELSDGVDMEQWNERYGGTEFADALGFGYATPPALICRVHGSFERRLSTCLFEWHVFCYMCSVGSWHKMDAEEAAAAYARHETAYPRHRVVVGWDTYRPAIVNTSDGNVPDLDGDTGQGTLFVSEEVREKVLRAEQAALRAVKRAAVQRRRPARPRSQTVPPAPTWKPTRTNTGQSLEQVMEAARLAKKQQASGEDH